MNHLQDFLLFDVLQDHSAHEIPSVESLLKKNQSYLLFITHKIKGFFIAFAKALYSLQRDIVNFLD